MLATVFLTVLIIALGIGNAFLALTNPKRLQRLAESEMNGSPEAEASFPQGFAQNGSSQGFVQNSFSEASGQQSGQHDFEQEASKNKIDYLSKRIERLEQLLLKLGNSKFVAQKINGANLGQKLSDFDEFRQNTRLEIAALKERIGNPVPPKEAKKPKGPEISDEKLRELVFRASH